jgi:hypothetical protein
VDQQAALRWVQKYVSLLVLLMVDIRDRKIIFLFFFIPHLFFCRSVNSVETRIKSRSGEIQPVLAQFYNMLSQMVEKHCHHFSELQ